MMKRSLRRFGSALGGFAAGALLVAALGERGAGAQAPAPSAPEAVEARGTARDLSRAFKTAFQQVHPSVVNISSVRIVKPGAGLPPGHPGLGDGGGGGPFDDFFERFFGPRMPPRGGMKQTGVGTGVIVRPDGHILTNNHVVEGADEVTVKLNDGRERRAKVVGTDPKTDLAVIKIEETGLSPARLGDSDRLEVGEWVLAVGNALGLSETLTSGIVSATGRANVGIADYEDFIQTDAAINPGNSGGPLVNLDGEVVGINTAIFSRSGGYMGVGFAIPVNMARHVMESILSEGRVVRGYLGVTIQDLDEGLARSFGYDSEQGALVNQVMPDTPAARAGLQEGDIIVALNGRPVEDTTALRNRVADLAPGAPAELSVFRDRARRTLEVRIAELPAEPGGGKATRQATESGRLGMSVQPLTPELRRRLELEDGVRGVVVASVEPGGAADDAGIRAGDVIVQVQGEATPDMAAFRAQVQDRDLGAGVRLRVRRGTATFYAFVRPE